MLPIPKVSLPRQVYMTFLCVCVVSIFSECGGSIARVLADEAG